VSGCNEDRYNIRDINYYEGDDGLVMEFLENAPPTEVYETSEFPIKIMIFNKGAFDVINKNHAELTMTYDGFYLEEADSQGFKSFFGTDPDLITDNPDFINLTGKSPAYPNGNFMLFSLGSLKASTIKGTREMPETSISLNLCYPYNTTMVDTVCVDTNLYKENLRTQVCEATDLNLRDQGAPVAVKQVEVEMQPVAGMVRPVFVVHVENVGGGNLLAPGENCLLQSKKRNSWNQANISAYLSNITLDCSPKNIRLIEDEGYTRCYVPNDALISGIDSYMASITVYLNYVYLNTISKELQINRVSSFDFTFRDSFECESHQVKDPVDDRCMSKCEACARFPEHEMCQMLEVPISSGFACVCSVEQCSNLKNDNRCTFENVCAPGSYCCYNDDVLTIEKKRPYGINKRDSVAFFQITPFHPGCKISYNIDAGQDIKFGAEQHYTEPVFDTQPGDDHYLEVKMACGHITGSKREYWSVEQMGIHVSAGTVTFENEKKAQSDGKEYPLKVSGIFNGDGTTCVDNVYTLEIESTEAELNNYIKRKITDSYDKKLADWKMKIFDKLQQLALRECVTIAKQPVTRDEPTNPGPRDIPLQDPSIYAVANLLPSKGFLYKTENIGNIGPITLRVYLWEQWVDNKLYIAKYYHYPMGQYQPEVGKKQELKFEIQIKDKDGKIIQDLKDWDLNGFENDDPPTDEWIYLNGKKLFTAHTDGKPGGPITITQLAAANQELQSTLTDLRNRIYKKHSSPQEASIRTLLAALVEKLNLLPFGHDWEDTANDKQYILSMRQSGNNPHYFDFKVKQISSGKILMEFKDYGFDGFKEDSFKDKEHASGEAINTILASNTQSNKNTNSAWSVDERRQINSAYATAIAAFTTYYKSLS